MVAKSWNTKEWKRQRGEIIREKPICEWCGKRKSYTIHHNYHPTRILKERMYLIRRNVYEPLWKKAIEIFLQLKESLTELCPFCKSYKIRKRKTMTPKFHCDNCGKEFEEAIKKNVFFPTRPLYRRYVKLIFRKIKEENKEIKGKIDEIYKKEREKVNEEYNNLRKDTVAICKKCNFIYHKFGKKPCSKCKERYINSRFETCFDCLDEKKKKGIIQKKKEQEESMEEMAKEEKEFEEEIRKELRKKV